MMRAQSALRTAFLLSAIAGSAALLLSPAAAVAQGEPPPSKSEPPKQEKPAAPDTFTIHIEVTAGEKNKPVENASVYIRYPEARKFRSDKLIEMDMKTSAEGKVRVPLVPKGRILIQVVAEGWKTYGHWFDLTQDGQVFKIHLDPPHHWY
jgi:hypothetical protein